MVAGFLPETGGCRNLPKLVGYGRAMELTLTGRILTAQEALEIGLVEFVVPHDNLMEEAFNLAGKIAMGPPTSVREAKRLMKTYWDHNKSDAGFKDELDTVLEITRDAGLPGGHSGLSEQRETEIYGSDRFKMTPRREWFD